MNPQFKRKLIGVAVASCFAGTAYGNPVGPAVISGSVGFGTAGKTLTVTNSPGAIINWRSFSIAADETTRFIQQSAASSVLNRVVGVDPSAIFGLLQSNGRVFLINPNGILFGATARIDVPGFVASTLDISNADFLNGRFNFAETPGAAGIKNEGSITTSTGGFVYLVATDIENTGIITSPQGEVILAAGKSVELVNPGSPDIRVVLTAPDNQALNVGSIVAKSGRIGIYGGLISQQGVVNANTVVKGKNGEIVFKATQDITLEPGSVTTASGEGRGVKDGGEIRIIADGTLNVKEGSEIHVDGGPRGGDGGFLELSGKRLVLNGEYTGRAQPGYQGGSLLLDPDNIDIVTGGLGLPGASTSAEALFAIDPINLDYGGFTDVTLSADNMLRVLSPISNADINGGAAGGSLTLNAGSLVLVDAPIGDSGTLFDHDLNLRSQNDVVVQNSIFMGNRTLNLEADVAIGSLVSPTGIAGDGFGDVFISPSGGPVTVSTLGNINVNASVLGVMGGSGSGQWVKVSAGNDINLNLSGSTCLLGECGAFGVIGGMGDGAFAEVTSGNDIKILATDLSSANVAVWGGVGNGAYAKLRAGNDLVLDLRPSPSSIESFGGGWLDVFASGGGNNAFSEASAGRNIESKVLTPDGYGGLTIGAPTTIGGVIVEGGSVWGSTGAGNLTATLSAGYNSAGVPRTDGEGSINLDLAYGMEVLGGYVDHFLDGAEGGASVATDASALMRAAQDITINVAGTGLASFSSAARIEGGSAFAMVRNAISGAASASATANAAVTAYGGQVSITVANGGIMIGGGAAQAGALHSISGSANSAMVSGNHTAAATANTAISGKTGVTLQADNGPVRVNNDSGFGGGSGARAFAEHFLGGSYGGAPVNSTLSGNNTATATTQVSITASAGDLTVSGNTGLAISGGSVSAGASNGIEDFSSSGAAVNGNTLSGNNTATAYGGVTLSASGKVSLSGNAGTFVSMGVMVSGGRTTEAGAASFHSGGLNNTTSGNNTAQAYGGVTVSGASITIAADTGDIEIWNDGAFAGAGGLLSGNVTGARINDIPTPGANQAFASNAVTITATDPAGTTGVEINASSGSVFIGNDGVMALAGHLLGVNTDPMIGGSGAFFSPSGFAVSSVVKGAASATADSGVTINGGPKITVNATGMIGIAGGNAGAIAGDIVNGSGNTVAGNATAAATSKTSLIAGAVTISGDSDVVLIARNGGSSGSAGSIGGAFAQAGQIVSGANNTLGATGTAHSATATSQLEVKASTGGLTVASQYGGVQINLDSFLSPGAAFALAGQMTSGSAAAYGNTVTGNATATATNALALSAYGGVNVAAYGGIDVYGIGAGVIAGQMISGWANVPYDNTFSGNQSATGTGTLSISSSYGGVTLSATNGSINIGAGSTLADALQSASTYHSGSVAGPGNSLSGNQTATGASTLSVTAPNGALSIASAYGGIGISAAGASASAFQYAYEYSNGGSTLSHTLAGSQSATAGNTLTLSAGGNLSLAAYGGIVVNSNFWANYADAAAYQYASTQHYGSNGAFTGHSLTAPTQSAGATKTLTLSGANVTLNGSNGGVTIYGGSASAYAYQQAYGDNNYGGVTGHTLTVGTSATPATQTASATNTISIGATGNLSITAPGGSVNLNGNLGRASGSAYQSAGLNTYGSGGTGHVLTGNQSATASKGLSLTAGTAGTLTLQGYGGVRIGADGGEGGFAWAYQDANANHYSSANSYGGEVGHELTGNQTAAGTDTVTVSGGTVAITADYGGVMIHGGWNEASAYQYANLYNQYGGIAGSTLSGNQSATATGTLTVGATNGSLTVSALNAGDIHVNAGDYMNHRAYASGYQNAYITDYGTGGVGHSLTGNQSATASNTASVTATGAVTLNADGMLHIAGGMSTNYYNSASAYAYQQANTYHSASNGAATGYGGFTGSTLSGNQTAAATKATTVSGASVTLTGAYGGVMINGPRVWTSAYQYGYGYNSGGGTVTGHSLTGNQTGTATGSLTVSATSGNLTVSAPYGGDILVNPNYPHYTGASAYQQAQLNNDYGQGGGYTLSGNQSATANNTLTLSASGNVSLSAYGGIFVNPQYYYDWAYAFGSQYAQTDHNGAVGGFVGHDLTGNQSASANKTLSISGQNVALTGSNGGVQIYTGSAGASGYQDGYGQNNYGGVVGHTLEGNRTVTASNTVEVKATNGALTVSAPYGGSVSVWAGDAYAEGSQYASLSDQGTGGTGHSVSGNNTVTATSGIKLSATGALTLSAYGNVDVSASWAYAWNSQGAYTNHYGSNGANAGYGGFTGHTVSGDQTMTAKNSVALSGATVDVTAAYGGVYLYGGEASASAYQYGQGYNQYGAMAGHSVTGDLTSTATGELTISATGGINISAPKGSVYISASSAWAGAEQWASFNNYEATGLGGAGHTVSGTLTPTATANLAISAGGDVTVNAAYGAYIYGSSASAWASQYAYSWASSAYGGALGHSLTGTITAKATDNLTVTGANITINGGYSGVQISASSAEASASQNAYAYNYGQYGGVTGSALAGNITADADSKVKLSATGNITLTAPYGGSVSVYGSSASASASQYAYIYDNGIGGTGHTLSGNTTAKATNALELTAGGSLTLSAPNGSVYIYGSDAWAWASKDAYTQHNNFAAGVFTGSTLSGNQTATAVSSVKLSGANISISGAYGAQISGSWASASASQYAAGYNAYGAVVGHALTGDTTASADSSVVVTATGNLAVTSAYGGIYVYGDSAEAEASQYAYLSGVPGATTTHTLSGNPKADAKSSIVLSAGTGNLTLQAYGGGVGIYGDDASGSASQYGYDGAKLSGSVSATGTSEIKLSAGGNIQLYGNYIDIYGSDADASARQYASGVATNVSGTVKGTAVTDITLAATGNLALTAPGGGVNVFNSDASAYAYQNVYGVYGGGVGTTLSGTNTAEAASRLKLSAGGNLTLSGAYANISASSGSASAYQYVYGEKATVSGTNTAKATMDLTVAAGGNLTVTAPGGLSVDNGSEYEASAYQSVNGSNHTVNGTNTAAMNAKVALTASGTMNVTGPLSIYAAWPSSNYAYQGVSGTGNNVNGANASTMNLNVALSAGALTLSSVNLYGTSTYWNSAYQSVSGTGHTGGGTNTVNTATTVTLTATGAMTIASGGLDLSPGYASAYAYRSLSSGNTLTGTNSANAESSMRVSAGSLTVTSGDVGVNGSQAYAYTSGTGDNRATAKSTATLNTGRLVAYGGGLYVNGGYAYASHSGAGVGAPVADASATVNSAVVNVSGDVYLNGGSAYTFTSGAGAPKADANASILMGAGAKTMTVGGSLNLYGGFTDFTGAGTPSAYALIDPGQLTITTGGNVHLIGGEGVNTFAGLHAFGPIVLNIGGSELELRGGPGSKFGTGSGRSGLFEGTGTGFEPGTGSNITVSFTSGAGTIIVDNTCSFCGDAFVRTEPTVFEFAPPAELFIPDDAPTPPDDDKKKTTVSGSDDGGEQDGASEDDGLPTCS